MILEGRGINEGLVMSSLKESRFTRRAISLNDILIIYTQNKFQVKLEADLKHFL